MTISKTEILAQALQNRVNEVLEYQINIDNYTRAINKIDTEYADQDCLTDFRAQLADLLANSKLEQKKAIIIRDVIQDQLDEIGGNA